MSLVPQREVLCYHCHMTLYLRHVTDKEVVIVSSAAQSVSATTEKERRAAFLASLSRDGMTAAPSNGGQVYRRLLGLRPRGRGKTDLLAMIEEGLPLSAGENLAAHFGVESKQFFMRYVGMSDSTVRRRIKSGQVLTSDESDRVVRYAHLLSMTTNLMSGSEEAAREWLSSPAPALEGATPLETAVTEAGARRVEDLIVALDYGMFT